MADLLYRRARSAPAALPFGAFDAAGNHWTNLVNSPEGRTACGFVEAPAQPDYDPATHTARWDARSEAWVVEALPPPPPPPMPTLTKGQFGEGLWRDELVSYDEYLAFVGPGVVPPPLLAILDALPDDDTDRPTPRKVATGLVVGAKTYIFDDPLVDVVRQAQGWTPEYLRDRWLAWAIL